MNNNFIESSPEEQLSPPAFVKELNSVVASEGSTYQLECKVQGNPLPTVQWFKNDVNIDNSPDYVTTYNNGEAILKFEEVYLTDQGVYTCKAANRIGHATTSAALTVEGKTDYCAMYIICLARLFGIIYVIKLIVFVMRLDDGCTIKYFHFHYLN